METVVRHRVTADRMLDHKSVYLPLNIQKLWITELLLQLFCDKLFDNYIPRLIRNNQE